MLGFQYKSANLGAEKKWKEIWYGNGFMTSCTLEKEFFIDNLLVRIHVSIEMSLVDRPCAMSV